ncbi:MAG: putative beta-Ala-His dipeptidase [Candidatus Collierbacteria bacterium GW2011_GWA2_46_26]|uniref:Putative beta-Ala-His dipeptidase n=1 Tax=Candidatus Collierbacteria bacterium GW2011_GWA2_46_26 TaxID=1618381 RepID=A0A0G1SJC5_9BACT|nr:MAG: putative beta-Ala-His dipeptidase [Candidatus Collierbacteria bacterium GW2011_GWA2_46_26]
MFIKHMTNKFEEYKKLLAEFVKLKSVSTDPKYQPEIRKTVAWLKKKLEKAEFEVEVWNGKTTNPVVFASYHVSDDLDTVMIYGHYDVQPAAKKDGWKNEPFDLIQANNKLFGRGVVDNKGQILAHVFTASELIKEGKLGHNLKFLIEGNEETGNDDLADLMKQNKAKLACNVLVVSDGELTNNKPTIEVSLRGGFNSTLVYKTGRNNLHSGIFGGGVPNAGAEMIKFLAKVFNADNSIKYAEFYRRADIISKPQLLNNKRLIREANDLTELAGVKILLGEKGVDFYTQTGLRPTIQITGLKVGYTDHGYANIVPAEAEVRLNFRIVASQKAEAIAKSFEKFVKKVTPKFVEYELKFSGLHDPVKIDTENQYFDAVEKLLKKIYGSKVNRKNVGGAIPFVGEVKKILGVDTLMIPLCNEDCNMHGANENFDVDLAMKALDFSQEFLGHTTSVRYSSILWKKKTKAKKGKT